MRESPCDGGRPDTEPECQLSARFRTARSWSRDGKAGLRHGSGEAASGRPCGLGSRGTRASPACRGRRALRLIRIYECGCGYSFFYSLKDNGQPPKPRLRNFGPTLDPALRKLVAEGVGLRDAEVATGLHARALAVAAARLSLPVRWKLPAVVGRTIGRGENRPVRTRRRLPKLPKKRVYGPSRSWADIDAALVIKLPEVVESILSKVPPERVTGAEVEWQLGRPGYFNSRKAKLPRSWALALSLLESTGHYQARRIAFELGQFEARREPPVRWKILRAAGIRSVKPEAMEVLSGVY
jgi:hypothetical protein